MSAASRWAWVGSICVLLALSGAGCASQDYRGGSEPASSGSAAPASQPPGAVEAQSTAPDAGAVLAANVQRRIIYTATVELNVRELSRWEKELDALLRKHGGFVADSDMAGQPGSTRSGTWTVRVPATRFQAFLAAAQQLGEVQRIKTDSEDVGEEYADLEARIQNKQVEEQRLVAHLQRSTAKLSDILTVERELSRVREEIERMQGRLRYLANRTELSTVTLVVSERQTFAPPGKPTLGTEVARTFGDSLRVMGEAGRAIVLMLVALAPWALLLTLVAGPLVLLARRR